MRLLILLLIPALFACTQKSEQDEGESSQGADLHGEEISYAAEDLPLKGYLVYDKNIEGKRPGILVVHEWWGHNDYTRKRADMMAELGYTALAVDMYGEGKQAAHPDDAGKFMTEVMQNIGSGVARFNAALELLKKHPATDPEKIGAIGYCFGGGIVLHMARIGTDLDGVVSFHGSLNSMHTPEPGTVKAQILVCHGADDPFIPADQIEAFHQEMTAAGAKYEFVAYPGAVHAFTNPAADEAGKKFEIPLAYNAEADQKSWEQMQAFFKTVFAE